MIPSCNISDIYYMVTTHKWMGAERHEVYIEATDYAHDSCLCLWVWQNTKN